MGATVGQAGWGAMYVHATLGLESWGAEQT